MRKVINFPKLDNRTDKDLEEEFSKLILPPNVDRIKWQKEVVPYLVKLCRYPDISGEMDVELANNEEHLKLEGQIAGLLKQYAWKVQAPFLKEIIILKMHEYANT